MFGPTTQVGPRLVLRGGSIELEQLDPVDPSLAVNELQDWYQPNLDHGKGMAFTVAVIVNIVAIALKKYTNSMGLLAAIPLALQFFTGLYLFVLPSGSMLLLASW